MIKVEHIDVWGFEHAVRGMRNPLNSWNKSDSEYRKGIDGMSIDASMANNYQIGKTDLDLMRRLYKAGTEHRKYLRQIFVSMDITAPLYWWAEMDTYKIGTVRNSCSFMHKGVSKPFDIHDFSIHDERVYEILSPIKKRIYELTYPYETDIFKTYIGNNGRKYRVYKNGRIIAEQFEYTDTMQRHRVLEEKECVPSRTKDGYFELNLGGRNGEKWLLHRLIATMFIDNSQNFYTVNHVNGDKGNNSVENLEWTDLPDNIQKGFNNNLYKNGKSLHAKYKKWKNGHTVVDPFIKTQIKYDYNNGLTCSQLASKYDITVSQANNIISGYVTENQELFELCYIWEKTIDALNQLRDIYLETKDNTVFQQIRCLLPNGYNQRSTITMNYENVVTMIRQRTGHKLDEWNDFVSILKSLPYVQEIIKIVG